MLYPWWWCIISSSLVSPGKYSALAQCIDWRTETPFLFMNLWSQPWLALKFGTFESSLAFLLIISLETRKFWLLMQTIHWNKASSILSSISFLPPPLSLFLSGDPFSFSSISNSRSFSFWLHHSLILFESTLNCLAAGRSENNFIWCYNKQE